MQDKDGYIVSFHFNLKRSKIIQMDGNSVFLLSAGSIESSTFFSQNVLKIVSSYISDTEWYTLSIYDQ